MIQTYTVGDIDVDNPTFKMSMYHDIWLLGKKQSPLSEQPATGNKWPKIWTSGGKIPDFPKGKIHHHFNAYSWTTQDLYPYLDVIYYPAFNFRLYVNDKSYFMSKLPPLSIESSRSNAIWNDKLDYFQTIPYKNFTLHFIYENFIYEIVMWN